MSVGCLCDWDDVGNPVKVYPRCPIHGEKGAESRADLKSYTPKGDAGTPATPASGRPDLSGGSAQRTSAQPAPDRTATEAVGMPAASVPISKGATDRIAQRLQMCEEDVRDRPFSHPVAVGWYYEDVSWLLRRAAELEDVALDQAQELARDA